MQTSFPLNEQRNYDSERLKDLFVVTQLAGDGAGSWALKFMLFYCEFGIGLIPPGSLLAFFLPLSLHSHIRLCNEY